MKSNHCRLRAALPALLALLTLPGPARAGLNGQPKPPADAAAKIRTASRDILGTGDLGIARPALFTAVEANAATDLTDLLAAVVRDDTSFTGLATTFEDAARGKTGREANFVHYNLARLYLLRSRVAGSTEARRSALAGAAETAQKFTRDNPRDLAAWELTGDIHAERNDVESAVAAYSRITSSGAPGAPAYAQLKIGDAYRRANRFALAEEAYNRGIRADAADNAKRETYHRLYQGLAALYLARGNEPSAVEALGLSARVTQDSDAPYRLRLDVAQALLRRGRAREVLEYAEAALKITPEDEAAKALRDQARARTRR